MTFQAKNPVKSLKKTLDLVEELQSREDGARVCELTEEVDMGESAVHNHLATLREHGYVIKAGKNYRLSLKFLDIGGCVQQREDLYRAAKPVVEEVARETGEWVKIAIEEQGVGVQLLQSHGTQSNSISSHTGTRFEIWNTPTGKAILAHLSDDRLNEIITHRVTDQEFPDQLEQELNQISDQEYAFGEVKESEYQCLAVPIMTPDNAVIGSMGLLAPTIRKDQDWFRNETVELVKEKVEEIEVNLKSMSLREEWINSSMVQEY